MSAWAFYLYLYHVRSSMLSSISKEPWVPMSCPPPPHTHTKSWLLYTNFPPSFPFPPKTLLFLMAWLLDPASSSSSSSNSHTSHDSVVSDHLKGLIRLDAHFFTQYKCMGCPAQYSQGGCRLAAQWSGGKDVSTRLGSVAALIYRFYFPWILLKSRYHLNAFKQNKASSQGERAQEEGEAKRRENTIKQR